MPRVKRATIAIKRRRSILKEAKGYRFGRSAKERLAREALMHAGRHAFNDRRKKKGDFRRLWQTKIGALAKSHNTSYSKVIDHLKKRGVGLDRKSLAHLAEHAPASFGRIIEVTR
ncbi:MAG: 50S ribosomal protein L20 [Candidatus Vogelbacteria bacterium]|nr:50S ribosomal protein L20 [Candidatus Vogelbacteria bacterium]